MPREFKPHWSHEKVNKSYCRAPVHGDRIDIHQCRWRPKYNDDGTESSGSDAKWCGVHRPGAAEERAAKRGPSPFERRMAAMEKRQEYVEGLKAALAPFAKAASHMTVGKKNDPEESGIWNNNDGVRVTVADFQRAKEALRKR